jgi:arylsulfatase A-like enzyme
MWVHYFDPHYDYVAHEEFPFGREHEGDLPAELDVKELSAKAKDLTPEDVAYVRDLYDGEIAYTDHQIGRILEGLRDLGMAENTLIAVTADHGEEFLERGGIGHGKNLYDELIRVPLILHDPRASLGGRRVETPVEVRSVAKTLLAAAGIEPRGLDGPDLFRVAADGLESDALSEGSYAWGTDGRKIALVAGPWKLIYHLDSDAYELYNLEEDSREARDRSRSDPEMLRVMVERMASRRPAETVEPTPAILRDEERKRLEALGYIE